MSAADLVCGACSSPIEPIATSPPGYCSACADLHRQVRAEIAAELGLNPASLDERALREAMRAVRELGPGTPVAFFYESTLAMYHQQDRTAQA